MLLAVSNLKIKKGEWEMNVILNSNKNGSYFMEWGMVMLPYYYQVKTKRTLKKSWNVLINWMNKLFSHGFGPIFKDSSF